MASQLRALAYRSLGDFVLTRRRTLGWSQQTLAIRAGVKQQVVSNIENGFENSQWDTVRRLVKALGVSMATLERHLGPIDLGEHEEIEKEGILASDDDVAKIRSRGLAGERHTDIAADFPHLSPSYVSMIMSGKRCADR